MSNPENRWKCRECGGTDLQVSYPAWYVERTDYSLEYVECDDAAEPGSFYCHDCGECVDAIDRLAAKEEAQPPTHQ